MQILITTTREGSQERSYGPTVWSGTVEHFKDGKVFLCPKDIVKQHLRAIAYFEDLDSEDWYTPKLRKLEYVDNVWHYRIERPFND